MNEILEIENEEGKPVKIFLGSAAAASNKETII